MFGIVVLVIFVGLPFATVGISKTIERRHLADLDRRDEIRSRVMTWNLTAVPTEYAATTPQLVFGAAVISSDPWKRFLAGWRTLVGGEIRSYSPLLERARREAQLRCLEQAEQLGAVAVVNLRFETSDIGGRFGTEMFAYGTALVPRSSV